MQKRSFRKIMMIFLTILLLCNGTIIKASNKALENTIIYFYSPTCSSCMELQDYFKTLKNDIVIQSYNITESDNKGLLNAYCDYYKVNEKIYGIVPIIFVGDTFLFGKDEITKNLTEVLDSTDVIHTPLLTEGYINYDIEKFRGMNVITIPFAGLVNGLNPCSLSMLVFLLSLSSINKNKILKVGISYISGKFIGFLLLGLIFYNMLSSMNFKFINHITKYIITIICLFFIALNTYDFIVIHANKYEKIKLKLPNKVIAINHKLIKMFDDKNKVKLLVSVYLVLGLLISFGEFLCTGQVYLSTILTMINNNLYKNEALYYFIIYNIGFIIPLLTCVFLIYKFKDTLWVSSFLVNKMKYIKLINIIFFIILFIFNIA